MYEQVKKPKGNKSRAVADLAVQMKDTGKALVGGQHFNVLNPICQTILTRYSQNPLPADLQEILLMADINGKADQWAQEVFFDECALQSRLEKHEIEHPPDSGTKAKLSP